MTDDPMLAKGMAPDPNADSSSDPDSDENCIYIDDSLFPDMQDGDPITFKGKGTLKIDDQGKRIEVSDVNGTPIAQQEQDNEDLDGMLDKAAEQMSARKAIQTTE